MILVPAIDILGGRAVRLKKGDYAQVTVYNEDAVAQAAAFEAVPTGSEGERGPAEASSAGRPPMSYFTVWTVSRTQVLPAVSARLM